MKCVVTGGAGFIGSHLVDALVEEGHEVIVLDNLVNGKLSNLDKSKEKIRFIKADLRDADLENVFEGVDVVFHLAALGSVPKSLEDPVLYMRVNAEGTYRVLEAARKKGVRRVINTSSSSIYGNVNEFPQKEDKLSARLSPYAISKYTAEDYCRFFSQAYGLDTITLRYFNVFGPRQRPDSEYAAVIPKFISMMIRGQRPTIFGDGEQSRDFTYVQNVVQGNILAAKSEKTFTGEALNIANSKPITVNELVKELNSVIESALQPEYLSKRKGDIKHSYADNTKARELLDYSEVVELKEGLKKTVESLK